MEDESADIIESFAGDSGSVRAVPDSRLALTDAEESIRQFVSGERHDGDAGYSEETPSQEGVRARSGRNAIQIPRLASGGITQETATDQQDTQNTQLVRMENRWNQVDEPQLQGNTARALYQPYGPAARQARIRARAVCTTYKPISCTALWGRIRARAGRTTHKCISDYTFYTYILYVYMIRRLLKALQCLL